MKNCKVRNEMHCMKVLIQLMLWHVQTLHHVLYNIGYLDSLTFVQPATEAQYDEKSKYHMLDK